MGVAHLKILKFLNTLVTYGQHGQARIWLGRVYLICAGKAGGTAKPEFGLAVSALIML